jgi:hypothetical protein
MDQSVYVSPDDELDGMRASEHPQITTDRATAPIQYSLGRNEPFVCIAYLVTCCLRIRSRKHAHRSPSSALSRAVQFKVPVTDF